MCRPCPRSTASPTRRGWPPQIGRAGAGRTAARRRRCTTLTGSANRCSGRWRAVTVPVAAPIASSSGSTRAAASFTFSTSMFARRATTGHNGDHDSWVGHATLIMFNTCRNRRRRDQPRLAFAEVRRPIPNWWLAGLIIRRSWVRAEALGDFRATLGCAVALAAIALASMAVIRRSAA